MSAFDGQFAAVTLAALWGGWILLRPLLLLRGKKKGEGRTAACAHCASGAACATGAAGAGQARLVTLGSGPRRKTPPEGVTAIRPAGAPRPSPAPARE